MKKKTIFALSVAVTMVAIAGVGCAPSFEEVRKNLEPRAAFELKCPAAKLKFVELGRCPQNDSFVCTVGVDGCEQRAVYVLNTATMQYVVNTTTSDNKADAK